MKDIIAALEAKRVLVGVLVIAALLPMLASAQATRWIEPSRTWSIDFRGHGWDSATAGIPNAITVPLALFPVERWAPEETSICILEPTPEALPAGAGRAAIQQRAATFGVADAERVLARFHPADLVVEHTTLDGVSIAELTGRSTTMNRRLRSRIFVTATPQAMVTSAATCAWPAGLSDAKVAVMAAILSSIQMNTGPTP